MEYLNKKLLNFFYWLKEDLDIYRFHSNLDVLCNNQVQDYFFS